MPSPARALRAPELVQGAGRGAPLASRPFFGNKGGAGQRGGGQTPAPARLAPGLSHPRSVTRFRLALSFPAAPLEAKGGALTPWDPRRAPASLRPFPLNGFRLPPRGP